jgi:hypothetical protein
MKYYNADEIKTELEKEVAINKAFIDAWEKVEFPTKKDGTAFKTMSKNITGAKYTAVPYLMQAGENELTVYTWCSVSGYIHDSIKCYELVRYLKDETMKAKTENYQAKQTYLEQVYTYDLDDIKKAVSDRIAYLKEYNKELEMMLSKLRPVFDEFRNMYDAAINRLEESTKDFQHKNLYYAVKDTVLSRYPYV